MDTALADSVDGPIRCEVRPPHGAGRRNAAVGEYWDLDALSLYLRGAGVVDGRLSARTVEPARPSGETGP